MKINRFIFVLIFLISGHALAAPANQAIPTISSSDQEMIITSSPASIALKPNEKLPVILILPFTDNTGMKKTAYISKTINDEYAKKYPIGKFTILPPESYTNQVSSNSEPIDENVIKIATAAGADYVIKTDLQKIEIKRGVKGLFMTKWCAAIVPIKITIWNTASSKAVFDEIITERGDRQNFLGFYMGALMTASEKTAIERSLVKTGKRMDNELPSLQYKVSTN